MKHFLIVVDMQKDFVDGALGTREAQAIVPAAVKKIREHEGEIIVTYDTHGENYLNTLEGKKLPVPHCLKGTPGWEMHQEIAEALRGKPFTALEKETFGSLRLPETVKEKAAGEDFDIELIGLCTDICVISNALVLRACFPDTVIRADAACCAGVTKETHEAALKVMRCCQIDV